jgi:hypothetical protein
MAEHVFVLSKEMGVHSLPGQAMRVDGSQWVYGNGNLMLRPTGRAFNLQEYKQPNDAIDVVGWGLPWSHFAHLKYNIKKLRFNIDIEYVSPLNTVTRAFNEVVTIGDQWWIEDQWNTNGAYGTYPDIHVQSPDPDSGPLGWPSVLTDRNVTIAGSLHPDDPAVGLFGNSPDFHLFMGAEHRRWDLPFGGYHTQFNLEIQVRTIPSTWSPQLAIAEEDPNQRFNVWADCHVRLSCDYTPGPPGGPLVSGLLEHGIQLGGVAPTVKLASPNQDLLLLGQPCYTYETGNTSGLTYSIEITEEELWTENDWFNY